MWQRLGSDIRFRIVRLLAHRLEGPDPLSSSVMGQWDKAYICYGSQQTLTDSPLSDEKSIRYIFLSDASDTLSDGEVRVCCMTVPDSGLGSRVSNRLLMATPPYLSAAVGYIAASPGSPFFRAPIETVWTLICPLFLFRLS